MRITSALILCLLCWIGFSKNGLDIALSTTDATFSCFSQQGATFVIVQAYMGYGGVNSNALQNLKNARNRGFQTDIYMGNCPGKDAYVQINEMLNAVDRSYFDTVWVRVEPNSSPGCSWTSNSPQKNCQYLRSLINGIQSKGLKAGIFSSPSFWKSAFQTLSYCPEVASVPLWYGADDGQASFTGFSAFGGWSTPSLKMFSYQYTICGQPSNLDWKP
jgi:hypothetical protein